jgi:hypothetical protein
MGAACHRVAVKRSVAGHGHERTGRRIESHASTNELLDSRGALGVILGGGRKQVCVSNPELFNGLTPHVVKPIEHAEYRRYGNSRQFSDLLNVWRHFALVYERKDGVDHGPSAAFSTRLAAVAVVAV